MKQVVIAVASTPDSTIAIVDLQGYLPQIAHQIQQIQCYPFLHTGYKRYTFNTVTVLLIQIIQIAKVHCYLPLKACHVLQIFCDICPWQHKSLLYIIGIVLSTPKSIPCIKDCNCYQSSIVFQLLQIWSAIYL